MNLFSKKYFYKGYYAWIILIFISFYYISDFIFRKNSFLFAVKFFIKLKKLSPRPAQLVFATCAGRLNELRRLF